MRALLLALVACGPSGASGTCKDTFAPGDLVITEVFADYRAPQGSTDAAKEWFEFVNNLDRPITLAGLTLVHSRPDGSQARSHEMADITIAPGQYVTLGNATRELVPVYIDYGYGADLGDFYNSGGGKLTLACGDQEIDSATYDVVKPGHSRELGANVAPDYTVNDDLANWCEGDATEFETGNYGTPGSESDCQPIVQGSCSDGGTLRPVVTPLAGDLVITEVMPSPASVSDTTGEWFEAKAMAAIDLNGVGLDRAGDTANPKVITDPNCVHVAPGDYVLFVKSIDMAMNGNLPSAPIKGTFNFSLVSGSAGSPGDVQIVAGGATIDAVSWTHSLNGKSRGLDPTKIDPSANDDESNFCDGTLQYNTTGTGTDLGTPGAINTACAQIAPPGMCDSGGGVLRPIVPPPVGNLVITEIMPRPLMGNNGAAEWFEITNIGATAFDLNGLGIDRAGDSRAPDVIDASACKSLAPAAFALFARGAGAATNGGLPTVDATFGLSMVDSGGNVQVVDPASCAATAPFACTTIYDAVTWTTSVSGVSSQVMPGMYTTTANDTAANYCPAVAVYGTDGNKGTPKAANACM